MKLSYWKVDCATEEQGYQEELMLRLEPVSTAPMPIHTTQWKPEFEAMYTQVCTEVEATSLTGKRYLN